MNIKIGKAALFILTGLSLLAFIFRNEWVFLTKIGRDNLAALLFVFFAIEKIYSYIFKLEITIGIGPGIPYKKESLLRVLALLMAIFMLLWGLTIFFGYYSFKPEAGYT